MVWSDQERAHFDAIAKDYESAFCLGSPSAQEKIERLCGEFAPWLDSGPPGTVLELGAGTGFLTRHLAPRFLGRRFIASDLSPGMLAVARATLPPGADVEFMEQDCTALTFGDASVAAVVGHGILHHVPLDRAVVEMSRVLTTGGRIAFYEPNLLNPYVLAVKKVPAFRQRGDSPGETALLAGRVRRLLRREGFRRVSVRACEFALNQTPAFLAPLMRKVSGVLDRTPLIRAFGGSLRILAERGPR